MIRVVVADLTTVRASAVVRPCTVRLEPVSPISVRLDHAAGAAFRKQIQIRDTLGLGAAVVTAGGRLRSDFVIHATLASDQRSLITPDRVAAALRAVLYQADAWEFTSIALPPLGAQEGHLVMEDTARVASEILPSHLQEHEFPAEVQVVVESDEAKAILDTYFG